MRPAISPLILKRIFARYEVTVILAVLILAVVFTAFSSDFLSSYNIFNINRTASLYIFIALGQAMSIIVGGMNMSIGMIGGLTVVTSGFCMQVLHIGIFPSVVAGLLTGLIAGFINGFIIVKLKLNSFVVTLSMSFVYGGLINGITQGSPYVNIPQSITWLGSTGLLGVPIMLWISVAVLAIIGYLFKYTVVGRQLLATGGNIVAAKMSAVNTDKMIIIANVLSGLFASCAAVLWISRTGSAQPSTGSDWMLISFAVAVIGGTSLKGGVTEPLPPKGGRLDLRLKAA